jgi:hypothetical protein
VRALGCRSPKSSRISIPSPQRSALGEARSEISSNDVNQCQVLHINRMLTSFHLFVYVMLRVLLQHEVLLVGTICLFDLLPACCSVPSCLLFRAIIYVPR